MKTTKQIIILILTIVSTSCSFRTEEKDFEHGYVKYWDKYSPQQLIDILYSDTLMVGPDTDGEWTTREFYINAIKELLSDMQDDRNNMDSLYPMTAFDKLTIRKLPLGIKKIFTKKQIEKFLEIINDPVSFDWSETTYEPKYRVDFYKNNKVVKTLTIDTDKSVIKSEHGWSIKKMKFGSLKVEKYKEMNKLLNEIGL